MAIVNQAMARYYFADGNPIGKHVTFDGDDKPYEIVGMVGDAKYYEIREAATRTVYFNIVVGLVAAYGPARRAARVDPMEALRYE